MKSLIIAASAIALSAAAVPALAQTINPSQVYINLGDSYLTPNGSSFDEITGRVGARFGPNFGVEGEVGGGVSNANFGSNGLAGHASETIAGAGYLVGYWPIMPNLDLLARVGYGGNEFHYSYNNAPALNGSDTYGSVNFGAGAQYMFTPTDGVRGDYTRRDYQGGGSPPGADTWAIAWVHKF